METNIYEELVNEFSVGELTKIHSEFKADKDREKFYFFYRIERTSIFRRWFLAVNFILILLFLVFRNLDLDKFIMIDILWFIYGMIFVNFILYILLKYNLTKKLLGIDSLIGRTRKKTKPFF